MSANEKTDKASGGEKTEGQGPGDKTEDLPPPQQPVATHEGQDENGSGSETDPSAGNQESTGVVTQEQKTAVKLRRGQLKGLMRRSLGDLEMVLAE